MGIIKTAKANSTGVTIVNIYNSALNSINSLKKNLSDLQNQIISMKENSEDYTEVDWKEVEILRNEINELVSGIGK